jgi:hypothetical protein
LNGEIEDCGSGSSSDSSRDHHHYDTHDNLEWRARRTQTLLALAGELIESTKRDIARIEAATGIGRRKARWLRMRWAEGSDPDSDEGEGRGGEDEDDGES